MRVGIIVIGFELGVRLGLVRVGVSLKVSAVHERAPLSVPAHYVAAQPLRYYTPLAHHVTA